MTFVIGMYNELSMSSGYFVRTNPGYGEGINCEEAFVAEAWTICPIPKIPPPILYWTIRQKFHRIYVGPTMLLPIYLDSLGSLSASKIPQTVGTLSAQCFILSSQRQ